MNAKHVMTGIVMMIIGITVGIILLVPTAVISALALIEAKIFPEEATHRPFTWIQLRLVAFVLWLNRLFDPDVTVKDFFTTAGFSNDVAETGAEIISKEWDETEF